MLSLDNQAAMYHMYCIHGHTIWHSAHCVQQSPDSTMCSITYWLIITGVGNNESKQMIGVIGPSNSRNCGIADWVTNQSSWWFLQIHYLQWTAFFFTSLKSAPNVPTIIANSHHTANQQGLLVLHQIWWPTLWDEFSPVGRFLHTIWTHPVPFHFGLLSFLYNFFISYHNGDALFLHWVQGPIVGLIPSGTIDEMLIMKLLDTSIARHILVPGIDIKEPNEKQMPYCWWRCWS